MIRVLRDLQIERGGVPIELPASKKTRALLGYLVATGVRHSRQHLCDLLWEGPDDPRAGLRWSLTKLRPLVDAPNARRLVTDRETVAFLSAGAGTDLARLAALSVQGAKAGFNALAEAASLLEGEFLGGLDLPRCYRFHTWLMAERQRYGQQRREVLESLIALLIDNPVRALPYAHALVAVDPLSEPAHAQLVRLLVESRQLREAEAHYQYARDLLQRELGAPLAGTLRAPDHISVKASEVVPTTQSGTAATNRANADSRAPRAQMAGRVAEQKMLRSAIETVAAGTRYPSLLMLTGEPGIGKTRLLTVAGQLAEAAGMCVASARCYEAEMIRPYGLWSEMRHSVGRLESLVQPLVAPGLDRDELRGKLFDEAASELVSRAAGVPLLILLDDLQWIDEGSAALLHFLVRRDDLPMMFIAAARVGELDDNTWARRLVASLEGGRRLEEHRLGPLDRQEVTKLAGDALSAEESATIHRASGGNPLFALNLIGARTGGADVGIDGFRRLVERRLGWLDLPSREIMQCAAAVGWPFDAALLGRALERSEVEIDRHLLNFEQHGVLVALPDGRYDFAHDLVRDTTYGGLSQARRRLLHRRLASALSDAATADDRRSADLAHHAALAEDHLKAAEAYVALGERCLSTFADRDAMAAAELGLAQNASTPRANDRARLRVSLLTIKLFANAGTDHPLPPELIGDLSHAMSEAGRLGEGAAATVGAVALSWASHRANDLNSARLAILRAEAFSRTVDDAMRCQQLANTGRCLIDVEADIAHARSFLKQAGEMASRLSIGSVELDWGRGLLARWDGDLDAAQAALIRAADAARLREGGWREFECLIWLAKLGLERGLPAETIAACDRIAALTRHRGGAENPVAAMLRALADVNSLAPSECLERLRVYDDKTNLAYVLNCCASRALSDGEPGQANSYAAEAHAAAQIVNQPTETVVATVLSMQCAAGRKQRLPLASVTMLRQAALSARAKWFLDQAAIPPEFQRSLQRSPDKLRHPEED